VSGTSKGGRKAAKSLRAKDPQYFSKLSRKSKKPRGGKASPGSFKKGNQYAAQGGKAGKRGAGKARIMPAAELVFPEPLEFEEMDVVIPGKGTLK
jgi:hypothetical protein